MRYPRGMQRELVILSGGQTGVDRAALDAALAAGAPCGGWCPAGRLDERGVIPPRYPLRELPGGDFAARTRQNVLDSDGTVVLCYGPPEGGTAETLLCCRELGRPHLLLDAARLTPARAAKRLAAFLRGHGIRRLNVAGPRASKQPRAYAFARAVIAGLLAAPAPAPARRTPPPIGRAYGKPGL